MEKGQEINCTVASCRFNNGENNKCTLKAIQVSPIEDVYTEKPDEPMCASYEYEK